MVMDLPVPSQSPLGRHVVFHGGYSALHNCGTQEIKYMTMLRRCFTQPVFTDNCRSSIKMFTVFLSLPRNGVKIQSVNEI